MPPHVIPMFLETNEWVWNKLICICRRRMESCRNSIEGQTQCNPNDEPTVVFMIFFKFCNLPKDILGYSAMTRQKRRDVDGTDDLWGHGLKWKPCRTSNCEPNTWRELKGIFCRRQLIQGHGSKVKLTTVPRSFYACGDGRCFLSHCSWQFDFCGWRSQHPHAFFILAELSATTGILKIPKIIFSNNMTQY